MADEAIAVIVAGSGDTNESEISDLLEDYLGDWEEVSLIVPLDKDLFTDAVKDALSWYDDDENVITVQTNGASMSRAAAKVGGDPPEKVETFEEVFDDPFEGFDKVEFLVALPESDAEDFETHVAWVEAALDSKSVKDGITVKNLCRALDDVVLEETTEEEPEPEPEPEKPARKRRSRTKKVEEDPEPEPEPEPEKPKRRSRAKKVEPEETKAEDISRELAGSDVHDDVSAAVHESGSLDKFLPEADIAVLRSLYSALGMALDALQPATEGVPAPEPAEPPAEPEKADSGPKRGRGRPRTNFEVKQVWDEDAEEWVPHPRGRTPKGTKWRKFNTDTEEVLDEGTA